MLGIHLTPRYGTGFTSTVFEERCRFSSVQSERGISIAICGMETKRQEGSESVINYAQLGLNASNSAIHRPSWSLESRCHNPECQLPGAVGFVNGYHQRSQKDAVRWRRKTRKGSPASYLRYPDHISDDRLFRF